jgi:2-polyprenyl-6-methoxyphenol hydroxylase-like FAD-dependent oxidoreductase
VLKDKRVLLLEGAPEFKGASKEKYSNRVSALSPGTVDLMQSLGAWEYIKSVRHKEVKKMQVIISILCHF